VFFFLLNLFFIILCFYNSALLVESVAGRSAATELISSKDSGADRSPSPLGDGNVSRILLSQTFFLSFVTYETTFLQIV
jgi:hypothetical protein